VVNTGAATAWIDAVRALAGDWPSVVVVAGPRASDFASAFQAAGAPPISVEGDGVVTLSRSDGPPSSAGFAELPERWADLVVLRSAWQDRIQVGPMMRTAARVLRPGGRVLAGEMDVARMMEASAVRYPARLLFSVRPDLAAEVRATTIGGAMLSAETVRAGFGDVDIIDVEEIRGTFPSADAYWRYALGGGWPALAWLPALGAEQAVDSAAGDLARVAPIGPVSDRVPFVAATGIRR
jgi:hypothetical protein